MGRRGPPPKPTVLKIISGNPGKRPLNLAEPELPAAPLDPPAYLKGNALFEWHRLAPDLVKAGILTVADVSAFAAYCEAYGTWRQYEGQCEEVGPMQAVMMGFRNAADRAVERMVKIGARFGLDASSRTNVKAIPPTKQRDTDKQRFFGGIRGGKKAQ